MIRYALITFILFVLLSYQTNAQINFQKIKSTHDVDETVKKLTGILAEKGMTVFATIDHQQGALKAEMKLRPTTLVIFGNPKVGTKLMQCDQRIGLDLPLKLLIYEDELGAVWIGYWLMSNLTSEYNLDLCSEVVLKIENAMASFAKVAAS